MSFEAVLKLIALIETELPTAVGLVKALMAAHAKGVSVDTLLTDSDTRLQRIKDAVEKELATP